MLYHSTISAPLFSPFPFSARVDMHVEASETVASDSIELVDCGLLYRSFASRGRHLISSWSNGPVISLHQKVIPRGWVEFYRTRLALI